MAADLNSTRHDITEGSTIATLIVELAETLPSEARDLLLDKGGAVTYHCVSRVVDRDYKFGDKEKAIKLIATQSIA